MTSLNRWFFPKNEGPVPVMKKMALNRALFFWPVKIKSSCDSASFVHGDFYRLVFRFCENDWVSIVVHVEWLN